MIDHVWIPMSDGVRLSARIWLPTKSDGPVPAVLEYIPYRKTDGTLVRDSKMHGYFAEHGYAAVRVDMRGSGDSEGVLLDEYLPQEHDDALEVLAWLEAQPWCTGKVGIIGKSWGGFNGLQIAARRPPQLAAVITVCSTDDRYADDVHYMGGAVLASKMLAWASTMLTFNALPPDPLVVGDAWRDMWLARLKGSPPFVEAWLTHQRRDDYWKHGSVCEDFSAITCPVYAVGGWADGYSNAIPRLLTGLSVPRKGLIGPWAHQYPHSGVPGPAIGFLQECVRWWDHWLKGRPTGVMDEPMLNVWMQDAQPPDPSRRSQSGRWVAEASWPPKQPATERWWLTPQGLSRSGAADAACFRVDPTALVGLESGDWCPSGGAADLSGDQRGEDAWSTCFDSAPLVEPVEILGFPQVTLSLAVSASPATVVVRLCDIGPDGTSVLVTRGALNLTRAESFEEPQHLEPGRRMSVTVRLNAIAHRVAAGHRLRVAISSTYWPWLWPPPGPAEISLFAGEDSLLELPVRRGGDDVEPTRFLPPLAAESVEVESVSAGPDGVRVITRDLGTGRVEVVRRSREVSTIPGIGLRKERERVESCSIIDGDFLSVVARSDISSSLTRGDWRIRVETRSEMTADAENFYVTNVVEAFEDGVRVHTAGRSFTVPRDLC